MAEKVYHKVFRIGSETGTDFIEGGYIERSDGSEDNIYLMINGKHIQQCLELRIDETLIVITCLSMALNTRITGLKFDSPNDL